MSDKAWSKETFGQVNTGLGFKTQRTTMGGISMSEFTASRHVTDPTLADSEKKSEVSDEV